MRVAKFSSDSIRIDGTTHEHVSSRQSPGLCMEARQDLGKTIAVG